MHDQIKSSVSSATDILTYIKDKDIQIFSTSRVDSGSTAPYLAALSHFRFIHSMAGNSFGQLFRITTFGESHGPAIGVVIDGCPAGIPWDVSFIQSELDRRRPGQSRIVTQRKESDEFQCLSGVFEGRTTGTPIALLIPNEDQRSKDYDHLESAYRPSHADYTYAAKYGHRDHRGGGRSSARETAARVAAGAVAKLLLRERNVTIQAWVAQVGHIALNVPTAYLDLNQIESNPVRCPDPETAAKMETLIQEVKKKGDTVGGILHARISGVPPGWGEPVFDRLHADLGKAILSINACKGFDYGSGFAGVTLRGSEHNDLFFKDEDNLVRTKTNHSGGIQGGISNGMDIEFRAAFKPVATLLQPQETLSAALERVEIQGKGRHDPCVLPRAVPIVEAMAALVLADHCLRQQALL